MRPLTEEVSFDAVLSVVCSCIWKCTTAPLPDTMLCKIRLPLYQGRVRLYELVAECMLHHIFSLSLD